MEIEDIKVQRPCFSNLLQFEANGVFRGCRGPIGVMQIGLINPASRGVVLLLGRPARELGGGFSQTLLPGNSQYRKRQHTVRVQRSGRQSFLQA